MAIAQPASGDKLNSPDHSILHRIIAADVGATAQDFTIDASGNATVTRGNIVLSGANATVDGRDVSAIIKNDGTVNPTNLLSNGDFENWSAGTAVAPDGWAFTGAGASIAREATTIKLATYSAKVTRAGTNALLYQDITSAKGITYWQGRTITLSCWVWASAANSARFQIIDKSGASTYSSYHTGGSTWELLSLTRTVSADATLISCRFYVETDTSAYFDGAMCVEGESAFAFSDKPASYLTGTWTPSITVNGSSTGITYTVQSGIYVKIGNMVMVTGNLTINSNGSGTGNVALVVPFSATTYRAVGTFGNLAGVTFSGQINAYIYPGESVFNLQQTAENGTLSNLTDTNVPDGSSFTFTAVYYTS